MHDVGKQKKSPSVSKPCVWITQKTCLWAAGCSVLCRDDTPGALLARVVISCGSNASSWAKKKTQEKRRDSHGSHVTLSDLASRFINKKNSSQYGPYLPASFHACAVTRICRISGTHKWRPHPGLFSPREPSQERSSRRLLKDLKKYSRHSTVWYGWEC